MSILHATVSESHEPDRLNTKTLELADANYPWHVEQTHDGWPQAGYDWKRVEVRVRRISGEFGATPEVQFEIGADEMKGKRLFTHSSSFHVSLALATKLARALAPATFEALEAYHTAIDGGIESDPEPWAKAERLYAEAKAGGETPANGVTHAQLLAALTALVECPDYRGIGTHEMNAARVIVSKAKGG